MTGADPSEDTAISAELSLLEARVRRLFWLVLVGLSLGVVVVLFYFAQFSSGLSHDQAVWGQFGDYVGGLLNPVFGFLTLIALLWTISLQTKELRLSTDEMKKSAAALLAQNETLRLSSFESTFFQLLRLHNDIVTAMDVTGAGHAVTKGRDCFAVFVREIRSKLADRESVAEAQGAYLDFYNKRQRDLGHYFRLLYHIVKFVDRSSVTNKKFYTNLVRAQLSNDELRVLAINCLTPLGRKKFKPLIERYGLLKTLPPTGIPSPLLRKEYGPAAFQEE